MLQNHRAIGCIGRSVFRARQWFSTSAFPSSQFDGTLSLKPASVIADITDKPADALVLGFYDTSSTDSPWTSLSYAINVATEGSLKGLLELAGNKGKAGQVSTFYDVPQLGKEYPRRVVVVGLGPRLTKDHDDLEAKEALRERIRCGIAAGYKQLASNKAVSDVIFDDCTDSIALGEAVTLSSFQYHRKVANGDEEPHSLKCHYWDPTSDAVKKERYDSGIIAAHSQNLARFWAEWAPNFCNPRGLSTSVSEIFADMENTTVDVHSTEWVEEQRMGGLLNVGAPVIPHGRKGSIEKPLFLEIKYNGSSKNKEFSPSLALVGKGVTFDAGGISLKPGAGMAWMRGDMGGAAAVLGTMWGIAKLKLPISVVAAVPLCENMPDAGAMKPGDVIQARNGLHIEVDNTDAEGRLILADALDYVCTTYKPRSVVDVATLTGAMDVALGSACAGVFATSDSMYYRLQRAGAKVGDPMWRMPYHFPEFRKQLKSPVSDMKNVGGRSAGSCTAAAFLAEFVPKGVQWAHIDIAGIAWAQGERSYLTGNAMTGRPTRALIDFCRQEGRM